VSRGGYNGEGGAEKDETEGMFHGREGR
jgi:hypothetical protein